MQSAPFTTHHPAPAPAPSVPLSIVREYSKGAKQRARAPRFWAPCSTPARTNPVTPGFPPVQGRQTLRARAPFLAALLQCLPWVRSIAAILTFLISATSPAATRPDDKPDAGRVPPPALLITNTHILSPAADSWLDNASVLIEVDRIKAVGPNLAAPDKVKRIDGTGLYLIPGLIDLHTHLLLH